MDFAVQLCGPRDSLDLRSQVTHAKVDCQLGDRTTDGWVARSSRPYPGIGAERELMKDFSRGRTTGCIFGSEGEVSMTK
jgi:hypothetical protein